MSSVFDASFDAHGKRLAISCEDGYVRIINVLTNSQISSFKVLSKAFCLKWASQKLGSVLAVGTENDLQIWKCQKEPNWQRVASFAGETYSLAWNNMDLIQGRSDGQLTIYKRINDQWNPQTIQAHEQGIIDVCLRQNKIITLAESIKIWNTNLNQEMQLNFEGKGNCLDVNENYLALGTQEGKIIIWQDFKELQSIQVPYSVEKLNFSMLGNELGTNQEILELGVDENVEEDEVDLASEVQRRQNIQNINVMGVSKQNEVVNELSYLAFDDPQYEYYEYNPDPPNLIGQSLILSQPIQQVPQDEIVDTIFSKKNVQEEEQVYEYIENIEQPQQINYQDFNDLQDVQEENQESQYNYDQYYVVSEPNNQNTSTQTAIKKQSQQINPLNDSNISMESQPRKSQRIQVVSDADEEMKVFFFYDLIPKNMESTILPDHLSEDPKLILIKQTIIPLIMVIILYEALIYLQAEINDFCYLESICPCNNIFSKIWSFFKQQLVYKFGLIIYKKIIIRQIIKKKYNSSKEPNMEMIVLITVTLIFDFITLVFMELNREYIFIIYSFTIGFIILLNTMKTKYIFLAFSEGRGVLFYDFVYTLIFCIIIFGLPRFYEGLINQEYQNFGVTFYYAFFPITDWVLEQIYELLLYYSENGFLFLQQIDLILIGLRVGTILQFKYQDYQFWYLTVLISLRKLNSQTMVISIFLRKRIFHCLPKRLKNLISMKEVPLAVKSRLGGQLEHFFWFFMVILTIHEPHILIYKQRETHIISDCTFQTRNVFKNFDNFSFCLLFVLFTSLEFLGLFINYSSRYDLIKWTAGQNFNMVENILTRMSGFYFFQNAFIFSNLIEIYGYQTINKDKL